MFKNTSNRFSLNYEKEAQGFAPVNGGIVDIHTHIVGGQAAAIYAKAASHYGIRLTFSMTPLSGVDAVKAVLGEAVRFIAVPEWSDPDPERSFGEAYTATIEEFYQRGSRIVKFWSAPRGVDIGLKVGNKQLLKIDAPHRIASMKRAAELGMIFMAHVGDPDTWFQTRYTDSAKYASKRDQYIGFERVLDMFDRPWIGAHMSGWPEDLVFLRGMLERHPNLYLDTSATKWMVRELSKHPADEMIGFFSDWKGRILFGSDIVTSDAHLKREKTDNEMAEKASNAEQAYDLYASRYWALRKLFESDYRGASPISDPDLAMVDPDRFQVTDAPELIGKQFEPELIQYLYADSYRMLSEKWGI